MRTDPRPDQTDGDSGERQARPPSWPVALASVAICLGTAALIASLT